MSELSSSTKQILGLIEGADGLFSVPRIDYFEFRDKWLALFTANAHQGLAPLGEWVQAIARGNPFLPVEVIRGGEIIVDPLYGNLGHPDLPPLTTIKGGELMFTVPPILNSNIKMGLKDGQTIDAVTIQATTVAKRMAVSGERFIKKNIIDNFEISNENPNELSQKMDAIFAHFGVKRVSAMAKDTVAPVPIDPPTQSQNNDDLDFEF